jgi:hypothetical protein
MRPREPTGKPVRITGTRRGESHRSGWGGQDGHDASEGADRELRAYHRDSEGGIPPERMGPSTATTRRYRALGARRLPDEEARRLTAEVREPSAATSD